MPVRHNQGSSATPAYDEEAERQALLAQQPGLAEASFDITSPSTAQYNCVAWAAGDIVVWLPAPFGGKQLGGYYWPETVRCSRCDFDGSRYSSAGKGNGIRRLERALGGV